MDIIKYKKLKSGLYEVTTDSGTYQFYEDVILKFNLLLTKKIVSIDELLCYHRECEAYYVGLKYIKSRTRSKKEVLDYLKKKEYPLELCQRSVEKLEKQGYLNDLFYARCFLNNKMITTSHGPYRIRKDLEEKGVSTSTIEEVLLDFTEEIQIEKIQKNISRMIKSNKSRSNQQLLRKIFNDLVQEGFSRKLIQAEIQKIDLGDDGGIAKKEYERLYKKYSRKYQGQELEYKIKQKMYQKGFSYEG